MNHLRTQWREAAADLKFMVECVGSSYGQVDMEIGVYVGGEIAGVLEYAEYDETLHIKMIQVIPKYQRQGLATKLYARMRAEHPGMPVVAGGLTDEGSAWWNALPAGIKGKTALPSWRPYQNDRTFWIEHDAVVATDRAGSRRTFEVWVDGKPFTRAPSLAEAKSRVEAKLGPLHWKMERLTPEVIDHYYWGPTPEFSDPLTIYYADKE